MNPKTENWRAVVESAAAPKLADDDEIRSFALMRSRDGGENWDEVASSTGPMRSAGQILAGMMRRGMLDALDEPTKAERPATTPE